MVRSYRPIKPARVKKSQPSPNPSAKVKVCEGCLYPYPQAKGFFSDYRAKLCLKCAKRKRERAAFLKSWIAESKQRRAEA